MTQSQAPTGSHKKKVVFILSTSYAGSHYLSLLLGSHSRALHIGEVVGLGTHKREDYLRTGEVFAGIGPDNLRDVHQIIFSRCDPDTELLVDTSKKMSWAENFLDDDRFERRFVHLIRDPRALVRRHALAATPERARKMRFKIARKIPALAFSIWGAPESDLWMYQWLLENRRITRFIQRHELQAETITYRDTATNPARELARLMRWLDMDYEPGQLEYWNRQQIGSRKADYDWVKEKKVQHFDLRWQTELSAEAQQRVQANRRVKDYLAEMKMTFTADGLHRESSAYG